MSSSGAGTGPPGPTGATGPTGAAGAPGAVVAGTTVTVIAAQMLTLFSVSRTIAAAPGSLKMYVVSAVAVEYVPGVTGFDTPFSLQTFYGTPGTTTKASTTNGDIGGTVPVATTLTLALPGGGTGSSAPSYARTLTNNQPLTFSSFGSGSDPNLAGPIVSKTIAAAGLAYVANDTGTIDGNIYGAAATYRVDTVGALGIVTGLTITSAGTGYTTVANPATTTTGGGQPGIGTGLTVNITALAAADGNMYVTPYYSVLTLH